MLQNFISHFINTKGHKLYCQNFGILQYIQTSSIINRLEQYYMMHFSNMKYKNLFVTIECLQIKRNRIVPTTKCGQLPKRNLEATPEILIPNIRGKTNFE